LCRFGAGSLDSYAKLRKRSIHGGPNGCCYWVTLDYPNLKSICHCASPAHPLSRPRSPIYASCIVRIYLSRWIHWILGVVASPPGQRAQTRSEERLFAVSNCCLAVLSGTVGIYYRSGTRVTMQRQNLLSLSFICVLLAPCKHAVADSSLSSLTQYSSQFPIYCGSVRGLTVSGCVRSDASEDSRWSLVCGGICARRANLHG